MEITVTETEFKNYHRMFANGTEPMWTATVEFTGGDIVGKTVMTFSHRASDPEGMWLADSRFDNGVPVFCHGEGARDCRKQIAGEPITAAIKAANHAKFREETGYTGPLP